MYGDLSHIPLFAKAGAIIPSLPLLNWGGLETPSHLQIQIFPGADNSFTLYDDDGNSTGYLHNEFALTPFQLINSSNHLDLQIGPVKGKLDLIPKNRTFELKFRGINEPDTCYLKINHKKILFNPEYNHNNRTLTIPIYESTPSDTIHVTLDCKDDLTYHQDSFFQILQNCIKILNHLPIESFIKSQIEELLPEIIHNPELLTRSRPTLSDAQLRALLETITRSGLHRISHTGEDTILLWRGNPMRDSFPINYSLTVNQLFRGYYDHPFHYEKGLLPELKVWRPHLHFMQNPWELRINYGNVLTVRHASYKQSLQY